MVPIFGLNVLVTSHYAPHYTCQHSFDIQLHKEIGYILSQISKISVYYNMLEIHLPNQVI